jgi:peptidoglycan hydrolase CwlO-like protein
MNQDFVFDANAKLSALENQRNAAQNECVNLVAELRKAERRIQALEAETAELQAKSKEAKKKRKSKSEKTNGRNHPKPD